MSCTFYLMCNLVRAHFFKRDLRCWGGMGAYMPFFGDHPLLHPLKGRGKVLPGVDPSRVADLTRACHVVSGCFILM